MFSFFKKKKTNYVVRVKEIGTRYVAGVQTEIDRRNMQKDVKELYNRFYQLRPELRGHSDPSGTMVITGKPNKENNFTYFVGDLVDTQEQNDNASVVTLEPGLYACLSVDFKAESDLYFAVAKAKAYFYEKWLPASEYSLDEQWFDSIELYDRRSNIKLASVELVFPLKNK